MKTLVIAGTGTWIFGQVAGLPQWADLSSTAAVIVLLGYVICRLIPSMQERHAKAVDDLVDAFRDRTDRLVEERHRDREQLTEEFARCRLHSEQ